MSKFLYISLQAFSIAFAPLSLGLICISCLFSSSPWPSGVFVSLFLLILSRTFSFHHQVPFVYPKVTPSTFLVVFLAASCQSSSTFSLTPGACLSSYPNLAPKFLSLIHCLILGSALTFSAASFSKLSHWTPSNVLLAMLRTLQLKPFQDAFLV